MSWEMHEAAKKIADGWYSELEETRKRNVVLGRENAKLREACAELLKIAESSDPEWLHWPEMHDELRELGVKIVKL